MSFAKPWPLVLVFIVAGAAGARPRWTQTETPKHTIVVTFDYDFTAVPACSEKVSKKCIAKFVVYDISGEKPYKLFTILRVWETLIGSVGAERKRRRIGPTRHDCLGDDSVRDQKLQLRRQEIEFFIEAISPRPGGT
jgi:hypothetical protein